MITFENTKTIRDLVQRAGQEHGEQVFLRYEEAEVVYDVTYKTFAQECAAIAAWTNAQDKRLGHKIKVGLMGSSSQIGRASCRERVSWCLVVLGGGGGV